MADYYVNTNAQPTGEHEVHTEGCSHPPWPKTSLQKTELVALLLRDGPSDLLRMRIFFEIQCNNLILRSGVAASRRMKQ